MYAALFLTKAILNSIIMDDSNLSKGADGLLLWKRLDEQILLPDLDYFAQKKILHTVKIFS